MVWHNLSSCVAQIVINRPLVMRSFYIIVRVLYVQQFPLSSSCIPGSEINLLRALQSIMSRKSSFLASNEWLTIPFTITPKDSFHSLLDLVFDLAAILECSDAASLSPQSELRVRQDLATRCEDLSRRLEAWYEMLTTSSGGNA
jgi:hypothetical protein